MSHADMYGGGKRTKASVNYGPVSTDNVRCEDCKNFVWDRPETDSGSCRLVMGEISPAGWCKLWEKKR